MKLIYESDLTGEKTISTDQVTSFGSSMPGWFYVNGATAGVYAYTDVNEINLIGFNAGNELSGKKVSSVSTSGNYDEDVKNANATTDLYITESGAYTDLEELIREVNPTVHPKSPATIVAYSSKDLTNVAITADDVTGSLEARDGNAYTFSVPKNPAVAPEIPAAVPKVQAAVRPRVQAAVRKIPETTRHKMPEEVLPAITVVPELEALSL